MKLTKNGAAKRGKGKRRPAKRALEKKRFTLVVRHTQEGFSRHAVEAVSSFKAASMVSKVKADEAERTVKPSSMELWEVRDAQGRECFF